MPAADEVYRLQRGDDPECRLFQSFADKAHYRGEGGTRQGIYVCSPRGELLGSINSLNPDHVRAMLEEALQKWAAIPEADRRMAAGDDPTPEHRWEDTFPRDGVVFTSIVRDLPAAQSPESARSDRWNRDHVWFSKAEARNWLGRIPTVGAVHELPTVLVQRLTRFHLIDNARGQSLPFAPREVAGSTMRTKVLAVHGPRVTLEITGHTRAESEGTWLMGENDWAHDDRFPRGLTTELFGRAVYHLAEMTFTEFELVALGRRWGYTQNNARRSQPEPSPIGFLFTLESRDLHPRIPPAFIDVYNADWLVHPDVNPLDESTGS